MEREIIPRHGAYRRLKSFQIAQLVYDVTVRFCNRYVPARSRTRDQMVQAARSGVQNIAEGSLAGGASREMEISLRRLREPAWKSCASITKITASTELGAGPGMIPGSRI